MKKFRVLTTALAAAAFLAGCGGSNPGDQSPRIAFTRMVNFGDSLSDVGTYKTPGIAGVGGGLYSINGNLTSLGLPYTNWTQYLASTLVLAQPCPAEVGLTSVGPGNSALLLPPYNSSSGALGQLTVPVVTQIANFKANSSFSSTDIVTVLAGGNDLFIDRATVDGTVAGVLAAEGAGQITVDQGNAMIVQAEDAAVAAMTQAGTELADLIKNEIVAGGATHVVVVNLPDVSLTPDAKLWPGTITGAVADPLHPNLTLDMTTAFNAALQSELFGSAAVDSIPAVVWVDAFSQNDAQLTQPATYGLTNMTTPACDLTKTPFASSLVCSKDTLIAPPADTVTTDDPTGVMHYLYADTVHPTPFGYRLLAEYVSLQMSIRGWL